MRILKLNLTNILKHVYFKNTVTHRPIARQRLSKHILLQRICNNRGHPFLGNGYVFYVVRPEAI
jgi:hypothetical protein